MDINLQNVLYERSELLILVSVAVIGIFTGLFYILYSIFKNPAFLTQAIVSFIIGIITASYIEIKIRKHEKER